MQLFWFIYLFLISSACFERCLRPSSGATDCIYSFWYCPPILLPAGVMNEMELTRQFHLIHDTSLMMGEDIARNMQSWLGTSKWTKTVAPFWSSFTINVVVWLKSNDLFLSKECCLISVTLLHEDNGQWSLPPNFPFCGHPLASVNISSNAHKICTLQSVYCSYPHNLPWSFHVFERMPHSLLCTLKLTLWAPLQKSAHFSATGATWNCKYMTQKAQNRNPTFTIICGRVLIPLSRPLKLLSHFRGWLFFFDTGHSFVCW